MPNTIPALLVDGQLVGAVKEQDASTISYDNKDSGLSATNVQDAIDEVVDEKVSKAGDTMSGQLTINESSTDLQLVLNRPHTETTSRGTRIDIGNDIVDGVAGSNYGRFRIYGKGANYTTFQASNSTANRTIELPNDSGTVALTSDIKVKRYKVANSNVVNTLSFTLDYDSGDYHENRIINGIIFSRTWSNPTSADMLSSAVYWFNVRPDGSLVAYRTILDSDSDYTKISSMSFDNTTKVLTITFAASTSRFFEVIYS